MPARLRPNSLVAIWLGGAVLAALAYIVGPDRLINQVWNLLTDTQTWLAALTFNLAVVSFDLLRAVAIGLFIVFVSLALVAIRRGLRGRTALVVVSTIYLVVIGSGSRGAWTMAFFLALAGAASMTGRLVRSEPKRVV